MTAVTTLTDRSSGYTLFIIIKAQLQGNKLIIEKLTIYDRIDIVKVVLASGFVGEASEAQLSPIPSGHLTA